MGAKNAGAPTGHDAARVFVPSRGPHGAAATFLLSAGWVYAMRCGGCVNKTSNLTWSNGTLGISVPRSPSFNSTSP